MQEIQKNVPTILVIFGATGDLMNKKIVPALFHLYQKKKLPKLFHIIGFSRRDVTNEQFRENIIQILKTHEDSEIEQDEVTSFLQLFSYHQGNFPEKADYDRLATTLGRIDGEWKTCANKLFYLAVPPQYYEKIFLNLSDSGLTIPCGPDGGWTRVLVEKPFGDDLKTAEQLDLLMAKLFQEEQIYRIDHYLAKEMLQNILAFRFSNNLMESSWNNRHVEKIEIKLYESIGVGTRGNFYDGLGALKDVGQNHLLQMLALVTMGRTELTNSDLIRAKRSESLKTLIPLTDEEIKTQTVRGQYEGYKQLSGVSSESTTETYFKIIAHLSDPRWDGVPIFIESGKSLPEARKEIIVSFNHITPCLCPDPTKHQRNTVTFALEPEEKITIRFWAKKPGLEMELEEQMFEFNLRKGRQKMQFVEEYEKLLLDCIGGNQLLFVSTDEVKAMWRFIDPIIDGWKRNLVPLHSYTSQTWGITKVEPEVTEKRRNVLTKEIGVIGLGKMGAGIASQLSEKGWHVFAYNRTHDVAEQMASPNLTPVTSYEEMVNKLTGPRIIWIMVPAGKAVDDVIFGETGILKYLKKGDIIVDAGNSFYKDTVARHNKIKKTGVIYMDVGVSGGPGGARNGACLMVGGTKDIYEYLLPLFQTMSVPGGVQFCNGVGAGHFVKMVHNGIEYGMMQAIGEGFEVLKKSQFKLDLRNVADIYNHGSVIESKLMGWLENALRIYGDDLSVISPVVSHTGEGAWTVQAAEEIGVKVKVIEDALQFRIDSEKNQTYTGQVVSALRNQFGGHKVTK